MTDRPTLTVHPRIPIDAIRDGLIQSWLTATDNGQQAELMWASMAHTMLRSMFGASPDIDWTGEEIVGFIRDSRS
jgi:hypothetical protein